MRGFCCSEVCLLGLKKDAEARDCGWRENRRRTVSRIILLGLFDAVYKHCLIYELKNKGLQVESEVSLPIQYKDIKVANNFRIDIWVNRKVIIELKATELIHEVHYAQLLTYLKLSNNKLGLLINFNSEMLKKGIRRVVNRL